MTPRCEVLATCLECRMLIVIEETPCGALIPLDPSTARRRTWLKRIFKWGVIHPQPDFSWWQSFGDGDGLHRCPHHAGPVRYVATWTYAPGRVRQLLAEWIRRNPGVGRLGVEVDLDLTAMVPHVLFRSETDGREVAFPLVMPCNAEDNEVLIADYLGTRMDMALLLVSPAVGTDAPGIVT